jgi:glutamate synthase domain-containing protein 2/glutamate synthase domain-containing protein 1/glutamate synthase domain-containing protein 3
MHAFDRLPPAAGLYDPREESDACGTGFVADLTGPSTRVLPLALGALGCMDHRGGVGADGQSGDGAGVLTGLPFGLFADALLDPNLAAPGTLAVAMCFLPKDPDSRGRILAAIETELAHERVPLLAWRDVPTDNRVLGVDALESRPIIRQALLGRPPAFPAWAESGPEPFERLLYIVRRRIERRVLREAMGPLHIASMSSRTIVYKGLLKSSDLATFFPDLQDPHYATAVAVFHQRFSTNTFPTWSMAQPFRFLGHNGEINTLAGNRAWQAGRAFEAEDAGWGEAWSDLAGLLPADGSDSACLDTMVELLALSGEGMLHAARTLVQPAWWSREMPADLVAYFRYHEARMEPWDGPAALTMTDGRFAVACQDRNGLRPLRWCTTASGLVIAGSEAGIVRTDADPILRRGRLGPGGMLAVDLERAEVFDTEAIHGRLAASAPWTAWASAQTNIEGTPDLLDTGALSGAALIEAQRRNGYGLEDVERLFKTMVTTGHAAVGSMGDDTPLAVLSGRPQTLYRFFKQRFAQVTNPPIDSQREKRVMSLDTLVGPRPRLLQAHGATPLVRSRTPLISRAQLDALHERFTGVTLVTALGPDEDLDASLLRLVEQAEAAARAGAGLILLSDRDLPADRLPLPMLLAVSAVHDRLLQAWVRHEVSLLVETAEPIEDHHYACLLGFGADLIHPWLAYATAASIDAATPASVAIARYRGAIEEGLRKILARMGVSCLASYRGARLFEILGLSRSLCDRWLTGPASRVGGVDAKAIVAEIRRFHEATGEALAEQGRYRWRRDGEHHVLSPVTARLLHAAVREGDAGAYAKFVEAIDNGPATHLRDLLSIRAATQPVPIDEVEPIASILSRFCTGAMSLGSLSREAHQALGVAMNRIGGKSNAGEGGEDPRRRHPYAEDEASLGEAWSPKAGDWADSAVKQVASARFGVTASYLATARQLEIKVAQGSKPGEGGQIPSDKVVGEIAALRRAPEGTALISPPPHHDIYSIEDLAQLIFDLKRVNATAPVSVKLVARAGVGTIAAGVTKAGADILQISGADGGTGASPLASIKHAGLPWEIGLAETQQVLVRNRLRGRVTLRVDGGLRTGRDVIVAALLGAEEFGFGTAALIAVGCVMARQCHVNTCPVGIATQKEALRARFPGTPEHLIAYLSFVAEQVRHELARAGFRTLDEAVGRVDRLRVRPEASRVGLDLSPLLSDLGGREDARSKQGPPRNPAHHLGLDEEIAATILPSLAATGTAHGRWRVTNRDRTLGGRVAGWIGSHHGDQGLPDHSVRLDLSGVAGQSFGAFAPRGMTLHLEGEAQDYVAKGLCGGIVAIAAPPDETSPVLAGNTVLYGATDGALYVAGRVGERLAVRNSGATAVVEGCGEHGCEYMTAGEVLLLGETGWNFGAGMSGGIVLAWDPKQLLAERVARASVGVRATTPAERDRAYALLEAHAHHTRSPLARRLLRSWDSVADAFVAVAPHAASAAQSSGRATA